MQHRQHIAAILKDWLQMTHGESQAIRSNNWAALRKIQSAKAELRVSLGKTLEAWRAENPAESAANPFRAEVAKLLALEEQNSSLLIALKRRAQEKKRVLEQALFNLRRLRSSYAKTHGLVLNSYS